MDTRQSSYAEGKQAPAVQRKLWPVLALSILFLILLIILLFLLGPGRETLYYVEDEFLLTGPEAEVEAVIAELESTLGANVIISLAEPLRLSFPIDDLAECPGLPPALVEGQDYVVNRYLIIGPADVRGVLKQLEDIVDGGPVQPEPNYLTGRPPETTQADPWSIGGSPWSIGPSPWSIGGSPWCVGGSPWSIGGSPWSIGPSSAEMAAYSEAVDAFKDQWAFRSEGIDMPPDTVESLSSGQGVLVGIFDTSPFPPTLSHVVLEGEAPLELDLFHPIVGGRNGTSCEVDDVRDHGLYSAGLVHTVAPGSEIRLIRVLDDTGQGDLQTLNRALLAFITEVVQRRGMGGEEVQQDAGQAEPLQGAVINLSLGVHPPTDAEEQGLPDDVASLSTVLTVAQCFNIVTVAAAGNDSALSDVPLSAQIPATWTTTIGVAASNADGYLSCFSNKGQIMAPGGDGGPRPDACHSMLHTCDGDCEYALISYSLLSPTGYMYWHGTSFSTPLVSGWAAVLISRNQTRAASGWLPQDEILKQMQDSGRPSAGPDPNTKIIDMGGTDP